MTSTKKTLGIFVAMYGNEAVQLQYLREVATLLATQIHTSKCSKKKALYTNNSSFMKTMEYPMSVTCFTEQQWAHIVAPALVNFTKGPSYVELYSHVPQCCYCH